MAFRRARDKADFAGEKPTSGLGEVRIDHARRKYLRRGRPRQGQAAP